jgi:hypothetical protein
MLLLKVQFGHLCLEMFFEAEVEEEVNHLGYWGQQKSIEWA